MSNHRSRQTGFTLLELMVTITIASVILGLAIPNLREFIRNNSMSSAANDFMTTIHMARSHAVKLHMPTVVCFTTTPTANLPACDGDGSQGWIAFVDDISPTAAAATDNNGQPDAGELVLNRHETLNPITVRVSPAVNDAYVAFAPTGFARTHAALGVPMDGIVLCDSRGNVSQFGAGSTARGISVSPVGRPSTTRLIANITAMGGCL